MGNINEEILMELKKEHKGLKEEHQELIDLVKIINEKLDKLVGIMEEAKIKTTNTIV